MPLHSSKSKQSPRRKYITYGSTNEPFSSESIPLSKNPTYPSVLATIFVLLPSFSPKFSDIPTVSGPKTRFRWGPSTALKYPDVDPPIRPLGRGTTCRVPRRYFQYRGGLTTLRVVTYYPPVVVWTTRSICFLVRTDNGRKGKSGKDGVDLGLWYSCLVGRQTFEDIILLRWYNLLGTIKTTRVPTPSPAVLKNETSLK